MLVRARSLMRSIRLPVDGCRSTSLAACGAPTPPAYGAIMARSNINGVYGHRGRRHERSCICFLGGRAGCVFAVFLANGDGRFNGNAFGPARSSAYTHTQSRSVAGNHTHKHHSREKHCLLIKIDKARARWRPCEIIKHAQTLLLTHTHACIYRYKVFRRRTRSGAASADLSAGGKLLPARPPSTRVQIVKIYYLSGNLYAVFLALCALCRRFPLRLLRVCLANAE